MPVSRAELRLAISPAQAVSGGAAHLRLVDGAPRKVDSKLSEYILGEPRTVERVRAFGAPDVGPADHPCGQIDCILGKRRRRKEQQRQR